MSNLKRTLRKIKQAILVVVIVSVIPGPVFLQSATAQTVPETTPETPMVEAVKIVVSARAVSPTEIPEGEPVAVSMQLWNFPDAPNDLDTKVTLNGFARTVMVDGALIAQVMITGVSKEGRSAVIDQNGFVAQFDLETGVLAAGEEISIEGNRENLIEAIRKLEKELKEETKITQVIEQKESDTSSSEVGGNAASNDQASSYQTPDAVEPQAEPVIKIVTTENGCSVRIDDVQQVAIQQSKTETYEDGKLASSSTCSDSEIRYPLEQSYSACSDKVDVAARKAWPQYTLFYKDKGGASNTVSTCQPDSDKPFIIFEKEASCTIYTDFASGEAIPQSALVYVNLNNVEKNVRGCQASTLSNPIQLVETTNG